MNVVVWIALLAVAADRLEDPAAEDGPRISAAGVVVTTEGQPIEGARVALRAKLGGRFYSMGVSHNRDLLASDTTDKEGKFQFTNVKLPARMVETHQTLKRGDGGIEVIAWAAGRSLVWREVPGFTYPEPMRLVLPAETTVAGQIKDTAGKPIARVGIRIAGITPKRPQIDAFYGRPGDINVISSEVRLRSDTDDEGRFSLSHVPANCLIDAIVMRSGYQFQAILIDTGSAPHFTEVQMEGGGSQIRPVQHSPIQLALSPQRVAIVKVIDHAGQPVTDGAIFVNHPKASGFDRSDLDAGGEGQLPVRENGNLSVGYASDPLSPRIGATATIEIVADKEIPIVTLQLPEVRWLSGRVVEAGTARGVAGITVYYAANVPADAPQQSKVRSVNTISQSDGSFRIPALLGAGKMWVGGAAAGYFITNTRLGAAMPKVDVNVTNDEDAGKPIELVVSRGLVVDGVLKDPDGAPVAGVRIRALNNDEPYNQDTAITNERGEFHFAGFSPQLDVVLTGIANDGAIGVIIQGDKKASLLAERPVRLNLAIRTGIVLAGRVLQDGEPQAGVEFRLRRTIKGGDPQQYHDFGLVKSDAGGEFRVGGLTAGEKYYFEVDAGPGRHAIDWPHQSPFIQTVREVMLARLPDVVLASHRQSLSGVVVDPAGHPVPGITVSAMLASGGMLARRQNTPPPWTTTNERGKFELSDLPDVPIEIMAYKRDPAGGQIKFPAKALPKRNQSDIRIVLDPMLDLPAEDLDAPQKGAK